MRYPGAAGAARPRAILPVALVCAGLLAATGCSDGGGRSTAGAAIPVPDPDLSDMEPQVAAVLQRARRAVVSEPDSAEAWGELGSVYDAHILTDLAEIGYRRAHELAPEDFRWVYLLAIAREISGAPAEELADLFGKASSSRPDYPPIPLRLGDGLWRRGRYEEARQALLRAIELDPSSAMARRRLGQVLLSQDDPAAALEPLAKAIELEPRDLGAYTVLSQAYARLGEPGRAREVLERSRGLEPVISINDPIHGRQVSSRNVSSTRLFKRAVGLIERGEHARAVEDLGVVVAVRPENASAHYWMGIAQKRLGSVPPAILHLSKAVELERAMNPARLELAELLVTQGRLAEAVAHYRLALRFAPKDTVIHRALAGVLVAQGDFAAAAAAYERLAVLKPLDAGEHFEFGKTLSRLGRTTAAVRHLRESLSLRPDDADAHHALGVAFERLGRTGDALKQFEAAAAIDPTHAAAARLAELRAGRSGKPGR